MSTTKTTYLGLILGTIFFAGCSTLSSKPRNLPHPVICDFTQFANKPPEYVKAVFPNRQWVVSTSPHWDRTTKGPVKTLESCGTLPNVPYIGANFYNGKLFEVMVFFWDDISPEEAARRVGLPISSFRIVTPETPGNQVLRLTGKYKGVKFKELAITDHAFIKGVGSKNIIATFFMSGVS